MLTPTAQLFSCDVASSSTLGLNIGEDVQEDAACHAQSQLDYYIEPQGNAARADDASSYDDELLESHSTSATVTGSSFDQPQEPDGRLGPGRLVQLPLAELVPALVLDDPYEPPPEQLAAPDVGLSFGILDAPDRGHMVQVRLNACGGRHPAGLCRSLPS